MSSSDTLFFSLPRRVQRTIDNAFDISISPNQTDSGPRPSKRRKISVEPSGGGGFIPVSRASSPGVLQAVPEHIHTQIPLDAISSALRHLDLPPDDEEILSVFRNAASGWTSSEPQPTLNSELKYVSRDDWRAVCAVLLEHRPLEDDQERLIDNAEDLGVGGSSDEYVDEDNNNSEGIASVASADSEDEYMDDLDGPSSRRRKGKFRPPVSFDELQAQAKNLTHRQEQTCRDTFALFFPHISASELENQRISIKDIQKVAKLLNEKLKADEMLEMLEMFSTSPDKTMGFQDFSCMMMTAKLA